MTDSIRIVYEYKFENGVEKKFTVTLDKESLLMTRAPGAAPEWARLEFNQCPNCPLDKQRTPLCPIAANLSPVAPEFRETGATDKVAVTVAAKERAYFKVTTIKEGLSPLLGVIMTTSGCPIMEPLKPMVRYHLPFASLDETVFRTISMYLMAQYLRHRAGKQAEWEVEGLSVIYGEVKTLNKGFGQRMISAAKNDANVHALVNLNVFAVMVPLETEHVLNEIAPYFASYLA